MQTDGRSMTPLRVGLAPLTIWNHSGRLYTSTTKEPMKRKAMIRLNATERFLREVKGINAASPSYICHRINRSIDTAKATKSPMIVAEFQAHFPPPHCELERP
jgi:hypothetical protein